MNFFTSYLGNVKNLNSEVCPVFVATTWPDKPLFAQIRCLAPSKILFDYKSGKIGIPEYEKRYNNQLANLNYSKVIEELLCLTSGKPPVLICYETPEKWCHRHLIARWIREHGDECEEWSALTELFL